jgi:hypothetical protein
VAAARAKLALVLACLPLLAGLGACGGGDESSGASTEATTQAEAQKNTSTPQPHRDSGGGAEQFRVKGGDNSIQEFGEEADGAEMEEAATALHGFLDARAAGEWAAACSYLGADVTASLRQLGATSAQLKGAACGEVLEALSEGVPASTLAAAAQADVGSLRREGDRAFILYHGSGDAIYAVLMRKEDGAWKVGGLSGTPLE